MSRPHGLTKSRFTSGLQCHRLLWWSTHERNAPELVPGPAQQAVFDQGTRVGAVARTHVPGGTLVDLRHDDFRGKLAATQAALASDAPAIYEASFLADDVFVSVDILAREPRGWRVIEVKPTTSVQEEHLPDAAIQVHVLRCAGLQVTGADVMVLNRACTFPDLSNLFTRTDVTHLVEGILPDVPRLVREQHAVLAGRLPNAATGPHCDTPHECPFRSRCWPARPPHHVGSLHNMKSFAAGFEARGWHTLFDLPAGIASNPQADRQCRAVKAGRMLVEGDLAGALARFEGPLAFLDFGTVAPAIPVWDGCHPYDPVPVQFSCHTETPAGGLAHHEWIAEGPGDPRPELARRVVEACRDARAVVAYNAPFEKGCLHRMADALPDQAADLLDVVARLADPLPVVREHVYHPDFDGSFSLEKVLPALVPDPGYDGLGIANGGAAALALARLLLERDAIPQPGREAMREALLRYCEADTFAMVRVLERLRELAREH